MKKILIVLVSLFCLQSIHAQNKKDRVEALKIAFITNALSLTSEEAQKFWPIFNEYETKKKDSRQKYLVPSRLALSNTGVLSDKEVEAHVNNIFLHKSNEIEFQKELMKKLKPILSVKKIAALINAESNFKLELLKKLKKESTED
jgi:hypothetical protein